MTTDIKTNVHVSVKKYSFTHQSRAVSTIIEIILPILHSRKASVVLLTSLKMHYFKLLTAVTAFFTQGSLAVRVLTYSGRDCTGDVQDIPVDHGAACGDGSVVHRFQSYQENGFGPANGQRIAFYSQPSCADNTFLYDTYSNNGDYFQSHRCYNIDGHSPSHYAQGMKLY